MFFNTKQLPPDKYLKLLEKRRAEYRKFTPLFCPCLNEQITFNSDGFNHLRFHLEHKARTQAEQVHKLNFLPHVRTVLIKASKIESYRKINKSEYWALCATIGKGNLKVRVIIRRIGNGKMHFWSVMNVK